MLNMPRSTQSAWMTAASPQAAPPLRENVQVDVAIVGAGLTGITAAILLKNAGKTVAVVDADRIGSGVTGRTTAHITAILDTRYQTIASDFGEDGARLAAQSHQAAIEQVAALVAEKAIDCDFRRVPGYLYTENPQDTPMLEKEVEAARKAGLNASFTEQIPLPISAKSALWLPDQAQFHPLKYLFRLAQDIPGDGSFLFENSCVIDINDGDPCVVKTETGSVTAQAVIIATHIPPGIHLVDTEAAPYRSYVLAIRTRSDFPDGLYWDTEEPYNYTRWAKIDGERLLIIGGKDHKTGQHNDTTSRYRALEEHARKHFDVESVVYRWSAQVYEPADGLAYIGKSPGAQNVYFASGYSGNGMTYANIAARLMSDLVLGRENPYADLYSPARIKPLASAVDYVKENLNVAAHWIGDRMSKSDDQIAEVRPGEGRIVEVDGRQIAAYRATDGALHTLSPVCTHMGCIVAWNDAESTWDCPCHGGRYKATGERIEGPPKRDLERVDVTQSQQS